MPATISTPLFSILAFVVAALLGAVGQFLYKSGADRADGTALAMSSTGVSSPELPAISP